MEFTTITRRVAEICGLDANAIEADPRFVGAGGWRGRNGEAVEPTPPRSRRRRSERLAAQPRRPRAAAPTAGADAASALAADARRRSARAAVRRRRLSDGDDVAGAASAGSPRAYEDGRRRLRHRDESRSIRCRPISSASRSRSRRARPATSRSAIAAGEGDLFGGGGLLPGQIAEADALALLKPLLEDAERAEDRPERQIRLARLHAARHRGRAVRRHDADLLRARRRRDQRRPRHGRARRALARPQADRVRRGRRLRPQLHRLRARADRQGDRNTPPRTPT